MPAIAAVTVDIAAIAITTVSVAIAAVNCTVISSFLAKLSGSCIICTVGYTDTWNTAFRAGTAEQAVQALLSDAMTSV
jgi:hypothetical protein